VELITYISFVVVSLGVIASPGPNVLVLISTSLSHGQKRGFQTIAGITAAMAIQLMIAATGTTWFINVLTEGFLWLKWGGVLYLTYLGINHLREAVTHQSKRKIPTARGSFYRGFWVSLSNPRTILFFVSFLPQFVSADHAYLQQIILLSATFWLMGIIVNFSYSILASKASHVLRSSRFYRLQNGASGLLFLGASAVLATTQRS
jgi:threonine/homoserine/homoserine lactone efflux protein